MIQYLQAHPAIFALIVFPIVTFLVTWLTKPRSPEDYAALNPRLAAALKFVAAIGFDAPKILESVAQLVKGEARSADEERDK